MAFSYGKLINVTPITATGSVAQPLYVNQSGTKTYAAELEFHNVDASARQITIFNVPGSGGSAGANATTNQIMKMVIPSLDTVWIEPKYPYVLSTAGDSIQVLANGTGVNAQLRGGTE